MSGAGNMGEAELVKVLAALTMDVVHHGVVVRGVRRGVAPSEGGSVPAAGVCEVCKGLPETYGQIVPLGMPPNRLSVWAHRECLQARGLA